MPDVPNLKASLAYRCRLPLTLIVLVCGWTAALFTLPIVKEHSLLDHVLDGLAWLLLLIGMFIRAWASHEISGKKAMVVVSTGPYALCRNPLYWGTFFIACSQLTFLRTVSFALLMVPVVLVYIRGVVPAEERRLVAVLGEAYERYCQQTARWLPRWHADAIRSSPEPNARPYLRELTTLAWWLLLPGIAEAICYLRELPTWPHWSWLR